MIRRELGNIPTLKSEQALPNCPLTYSGAFLRARARFLRPRIRGEAMTVPHSTPCAQAPAGAEKLIETTEKNRPEDRVVADCL